MNKNELKKVLKPLIKECIKEVIFEEDGALSHIIKEVAIGVSGKQQIKETNYNKQPSPTKSAKQLKQRKKQLLDAIGKDAYGGVDLFEGTQALNTGGNPDTGTQAQGALSGYAPDDAGVDITGLLNLSGNTWKKLK